MHTFRKERDFINGARTDTTANFPLLKNVCRASNARLHVAKRHRVMVTEKCLVAVTPDEHQGESLRE